MILQVNVGQEVLLIGRRCRGDPWRFTSLLQLLPQGGIFEAEGLSFGHHIQEILKPISVTVLPDGPVVLGASVETFPEEGLGEGDRDEKASRLQAPADLREEEGFQAGR